MRGFGEKLRIFVFHFKIIIMARKNYTVDEVLKSLNRKSDLRIDAPFIYILTDTVWSTKEKKEVENPLKRFDLGNGSWGKIDFLTNHCGYKIRKVENFRFN